MPHNGLSSSVAMLQKASSHYFDHCHPKPCYRTYPMSRINLVKKVAVLVTLLALIYASLHLSRQVDLVAQTANVIAHGQDARQMGSTSFFAGTRAFHRSSDGDRIDSGVANRTLGFEKILLINLPHRSDKLDAFALAAGLTGFQFDVLPAMKGEEVSEQTLPAPFPLELLPSDMKNAKGEIMSDEARHEREERTRMGRIGCRRSHLNAARKIVQEGLGSALIFEDDADWDINLKAQLEHFAEGRRQLAASTEANNATTGAAINQGLRERNSGSPYGDDWDMLWLGHCGLSPRDEDKRRFVISNDATVPPFAHRFNVAPTPRDIVEQDEHTRMIFEASSGTCLFAYALSQQGARKMLYHLGLHGEAIMVDTKMAEMCGNPQYKFRSFGVFPQLVDSIRVGATNEESDISGLDPGLMRKSPNPHRYTFNIKHSVRLNAERLLVGEQAISQWPEEEKQLDGDVVTQLVGG